MFESNTGGPPEDHAPSPPPDPVADALDAVDAAERVSNAADAGRIVALLHAWDAAESAEASTAPGGRVRIADGRFARAIGLELAIHLRMSPRTIAAWYGDACFLRDGMPLTWAVFLAGRLSWRRMQLVAGQAEGMTPEQLAEFDRIVAGIIEDLLPSDLKRRLHDLRERMAPESASERVAHANEHRHVEVEPRADGQAALTLVGPQTDIAAVYTAARSAAVAAHGLKQEHRTVATLTYDCLIDAFVTGITIASPIPVDQLDWTAQEPEDLSRQAREAFRAAAKANGDRRFRTPLTRLAGTGPRVGQREPITATLLVTCPDVTATGNADLPGTLAGFGPVDPATVRSIVTATTSWTRVRTDPITGGLKDLDPTARTIPIALRKAIWARDNVCRAPGCSKPAHRCDLDHVHRFEHGGPTTPDNLVTYCRRDHQIKDEGFWETRLDQDGTITWRSIWGTRYRTVPAIRPQFETTITTPAATAEPTVADDAPF